MRSSAGGASGRAPDDQDEDSSPFPYAAAKRACAFDAQLFAHSFGLETVRLRSFNVFGPLPRADSPDSGVIAIFAARLTSGRTPTREPAPFRRYLFASEVPGVSGRVYNVGTGGSVTLLDLIRELNAILGTNAVPTFAPPRAGDVRDSRAKINRIRAELGYAPKVTFADGLRQTLAAV